MCFCNAAQQVAVQWGEWGCAGDQSLLYLSHQINQPICSADLVHERWYTYLSCDSSTGNKWTLLYKYFELKSQAPQDTSRHYLVQTRHWDLIKCLHIWHVDCNTKTVHWHCTWKRWNNKKCIAQYAYGLMLQRTLYSLLRTNYRLTTSVLHSIRVIFKEHLSHPADTKKNMPRWKYNHGAFSLKDEI